MTESELNYYRRGFILGQRFMRVKAAQAVRKNTWQNMGVGDWSQTLNVGYLTQRKRDVEVIMKLEIMDSFESAQNSLKSLKE